MHACSRRGVTWPEFQQLHKGKAVTPAQWQEHNAIIAKGGTPPPVPAPGLTQEEKLAIAKKVSLSEPSKDKELELAQKVWINLLLPRLLTQIACL